MAIKKPYLTLPLLLLTGQYALAEGRAHHPNPMDILSGKHHKRPARKIRKKTRSRPFAPLNTVSRQPVIQKKPVAHRQPPQEPQPISSTAPSPAEEPDGLEVINLDGDIEDTRSLEESNGLSAVDILTGKKHNTPVTPAARETPAPTGTAIEDDLAGMTLPEGHETNNSTPRETMPTAITVTDKADQEPNSEIPSGKRLEILLSTKYVSTPPPSLTPKNPHPAFHTPKQKTLYLTFDDGPVGGTENLLRVLREENVKATLFCIGREVVKHPKLFQRELAMPNLLVANHTYTHANGHYRRFYNSPAAHVVADIDKAQHVIGGAKYLRLCGRNVWRLPSIKRDDWGLSVAQRGREHSKYNALWDHGYFIYGWDAEWLFSHKTQRPLFDGQEMARRVNHRYQSRHTAKPGRVVLLAHDFMFRSEYNTQQLRSFIQIMKGQGWVFKTIDDFSTATPDTFVHVPRKTLPGQSRPAQKLAKKATILIPPNQPEVVQKSMRVVSLSTQLSRAIRRQSFLDIRRLLTRGAKINGRNAKGELPLNIAIETNNAVLVRMLVERGARIFNLDANGMSPMGIARHQGSMVIILYLQQQIKIQEKRRLKRPVYPSNESIDQ